MLDIRDRIANGLRAVEKNVNMHGRRDLIAELRQEPGDVVHHGDRVRAGLALNGQHDGACVVEPACHLVVLHAVNHAPQFLQTHRITIAIGDDERSVVRRFLELARGLHGERLVPAVKRAGRLVHVALFHRRLDLINADAIGRQLVRVHLHAHGVLL